MPLRVRHRDHLQRKGAGRRKHPFHSRGRVGMTMTTKTTIPPKRNEVTRTPVESNRISRTIPFLNNSHSRRDTSVKTHLEEWIVVVEIVLRLPSLRHQHLHIMTMLLRYARCPTTITRHPLLLLLVLVPPLLQLLEEREWRRRVVLAVGQAAIATTV